MNLNEKILKVNELEKKIEELKKAFYEADKSKKADEKKKIDKDIVQLSKKIEKINDSYNKERENRNLDQSITITVSDFLNKGKNIKSSIENYASKLNDKEISDTEKIEIKNNLDKLNEDNSNLKKEIYDKAMEKSGLSWKKGKIYPNIEIKKQKDTLSDLEQQKKELEEQKEKQREIIQVNKDRMTEQFNMAIEKYQEMLASEKISKELFESRIANMTSAKEKDIAMLDKSLEDIDKKINDKIKEIDDVKGKITELEEKEKIFDEYNNVYYELFGDTLDSYYRDNVEKNDISNKEKNVSKDKIEKSEKVKSNNSENIVASPVAQKEEVAQDDIIEDESSKVVVTSKTVFNELYKKLTKGTITDRELNALTEVLSDKDNYDKYGITTGMVFNKARKILKCQGSRSFSNIDAFLKNSNEFSDNIKFDTSIENEDILSHEVLNSLKDAQGELVFSDATLSIEKYIQQIEEYKESGNQLSDKQQRIYKEAMNIKENLSSYRKALTTSEKVATERESKTQNSVFYGLFKNKVKNRATKALPEMSESKTSGVIYESKPFGIELESMVNREVPSDSGISGKETKVRAKDNNEIVK